MAKCRGWRRDKRGEGISIHTLFSLGLDVMSRLCRVTVMIQILSLTHIGFDGVRMYQMHDGMRTAKSSLFSNWRQLIELLLI